MKWSKENCEVEAKKFKTRTEFFKNSNSAYLTASRKKWLDEICEHMISLQNPRKYWTREKCLEESLKYKTKGEFKKNSPTAYAKSLKEKWLDELSSHMIQIKKEKNYWSKEKCQEAANLCKTRTQFKSEYKSAYGSAVKNGWLKEILTNIKRLHNNFTKEECIIEALKYENRTDFFKKSPSHYHKSLSNDWLDEICEHMQIIGNRNRRCIYVYEFEDFSVYVGLTYNFEKRQKRHLSDFTSSVNRYLQNKNISFIVKQLTDYIEVSDAVKKEGEFISFYRKGGWKILNVSRAGSIGGSIIKWNFDACLEVAKKYTKRWKFGKNNLSCYNSARKNEWLDEICKHMN